MSVGQHIAAVFALTLVVVAAPVVGAEPLATAIWLSAPENSEEETWRDAGFGVLDLSECASIDLKCFRKSARSVGSDTPKIVIARPDELDTIIALLKEGLSRDDVKAIFIPKGQRNAIGELGTISKAPPVVIMIEVDDTHEDMLLARLIKKSLRSAGIDASLLPVNDNMTSIMMLEYALHFAGHSRLKEGFAEVLKARLHWQETRVDHDDFFELNELIRSYRFDDHLKVIFSYHHRFEPYPLKQFTFTTYQGFDLLGYRDRVNPSARYATLENLRGQVIYLDLEKYAPYEPQIVLGVDDSRNMYEHVYFYKTKKMYSWKPDVQKLAPRLLGPTLHFANAKDMPASLGMPLPLRSALTLDGIKFSEEDPLYQISSHPETVQEVITSGNECIHCHQIGDIGGHAKHFEAMTMKPQGGFALPLTDYSEEVMRTFVYEQEKSAKAIGLSPNPITEEAQEAFYDWYLKLRKSASAARAPE